MKKFYLFFIYLFSLLSVNAQNNVDEPIATIKILWVGNSFTYFNDLPEMVSKLAATQGLKVENTTVLKGGEKLSGHFRNPELMKQLEKGGWDYMVLQEQSSNPAYSTKFVADSVFPFAHSIDSIAHVYSPGMKTIYYMTWGHKNGSLRQTDYPLDDSYETMQDRIKTTYIDLAYENNGWCAPVGLAWKKIREEHPEIELYIEDNFHPSLAGSYLAACTILATILQEDFESSFIADLDITEALILQETAQETLRSNQNILIRP